MQTLSFADGGPSGDPVAQPQYSSFDLAYLLEVLEITDGDTEDHLDATLKSQATELGISHDPEAKLKEKSQSVSTYASSDRPRRSDSVNSRTSHSTGLTSIDSEQFRDRTRSHPSSKSFSFRDDDAVSPVRGSSIGAKSWPFSPMTSISGSTFSLALSHTSTSNATPRKHLQKLRGLRRLKLYRTDSVVSIGDAHPHFTDDVHSRLRGLHRLPCNHESCTQADPKIAHPGILDQKAALLPHCYNHPTSRPFERLVMTQEANTTQEPPSPLDQVSPLTGLPPSNARSLPPSLPPLPYFPPLMAHRPSLPDRTSSNDSRTDSLSPTSSPKDPSFCLEHPDYTLLLHKQTSQRTRFLTWEHRYRHAILAHHSHLRQSLLSTRTSTLSSLQTSHISAISALEDAHVLAEAELRSAQSTELRDLDIVLAHRDAFCRGIYLSDGSPHFREISAQHRTELAKTRQRRESLDLRHRNAVNVLRGEQERRAKGRIQRQEMEILRLNERLEKEVKQLERKCVEELRGWEEKVKGNKERMIWRWGMEMEILGVKLGREDGREMAVRLPIAEWE